VTVHAPSRTHRATGPKASPNELFACPEGTDAGSQATGAGLSGLAHLPATLGVPGRVLALVPAEAVSDPAAVVGWVLVADDSTTVPPAGLPPAGLPPAGLSLVGLLPVPSIWPPAGPSDTQPRPGRHLAHDPAGVSAHTPANHPPGVGGLLEAGRVEAGLLEAGRVEAGLLEAGRVEVDLDRRMVTVDGTPVDLTYTEFEILTTFVRHAGSAISREQLVALIWPEGIPDGSATKGLNVHVHRLRRKLGPTFAARLRTLRGFGYRYDAA